MTELRMGNKGPQNAFQALMQGRHKRAPEGFMPGPCAKQHKVVDTAECSHNEQNSIGQASAAGKYDMFGSIALADAPAEHHASYRASAADTCQQAQSLQLRPTNPAQGPNAFAKLMAHLKDIDEEHSTVVMVQVENEVGLLGDSRDRSRLAEEIWLASSLQCPSGHPGGQCRTGRRRMPPPLRQDIGPLLKELLRHA